MTMMPIGENQMSVPKLPVIDLSGPNEIDTAAAIGQACRAQGFFYITGHGVDPALRSAVFNAAAGFFALPPTEKEAVAYHDVGSNRGYTALGGESLDPALPGDVKESFNIGIEPSSAPDRLYPGPWPDLPGFRPVMQRYFTAMLDLGGRLHRMFARDLGLDPTYFDRFIDRPLATLRLLHYPSQSAPSSFGAAPHTDYGNLTLLDQDDTGGLEVQTRDGMWIDAPPLAGALLCNIGDCMMRWSNDIYVSTPHRVINRSTRPRYSVAFFHDPNPDAWVACLPTCTTTENPPRYTPITAAAHITARLARSRAH